MDSPAAALLDDDTFWQYLDLILNGHEGLVPAVVAHDHAQRAEIERLKGELETTLTALTGFIDSQAAERARAEKYLDAMTDLTSLRARVKEYLAALDGGASTDFCHARECRYWRLGKSHGPCICGAVAKRERTICAEAALREEVERG